MGKDCLNMSEEGGVFPTIHSLCHNTHCVPFFNALLSSVELKKWLKRENIGVIFFCVCACVFVSATYVHFTLIHHIEVISFIAWRAEKEEKEVCERAEKKGFLEPKRKLFLLPLSTLRVLDGGFLNH